MSKQSLLLVDGDPRSLRVLEVSLRKAGFSVVTAESARAAQEKIVVGAPDLIISEIKLDDGDGFELCRRVRSTPEWQDIPFMFLTGEVGIENKIRGLELGVDEYLTKPIYIKEIVTRIHMLLQKRQRARIEERKDQRTRFVGRIADMPVVDVIQTIEVSRKSGVIHFVGERNRQAAIYFRDGKVIDAEAGPLAAEDAVYRLLTWSEGDFEVVFRTVRRREVIEIGSQALLMEGMRRLDEWTRLLEQLPPLSTHVDLKLELLAKKLGEIPDESNRLLRLIDGKRSLMSIIDGCDLGDLEALQAIAQLSAQGLLVEVEGASMEDEERAKLSLDTVVARARGEESGPFSVPAASVTPTAPGPLLAELAAAPPGFRPSGLRLVDEAVAAAQAIDPELAAWPDGSSIARTITGRARTISQITSFSRELEPDPPTVAAERAERAARADVTAPPRARTEPGVGTKPPLPAPAAEVARPAMQMAAVTPPAELPRRARSITGQAMTVQPRAAKTPPYGAPVTTAEPVTAARTALRTFAPLSSEDGAKGPAQAPLPAAAAVVALGPLDTPVPRSVRAATSGSPAGGARAELSRPASHEAAATAARSPAAPRAATGSEVAPATASAEARPAAPAPSSPGPDTASATTPDAATASTSHPRDTAAMAAPRARTAEVPAAPSAAPPSAAEVPAAEDEVAAAPRRRDAVLSVIQAKGTPLVARANTRPTTLPPGSGTSVAIARKRRSSPPVPRRTTTPAGEGKAAPLARITTEQRAVRVPEAAASQRRETRRMITSLGAATAEVSGEVEAQVDPREAQLETQRQMVTILPRRITREVPTLDVAVEVAPELSGRAAARASSQAEPQREPSGPVGSRRTTRELPAQANVEAALAAPRPVLTRRRVTEPSEVPSKAVSARRITREVPAQAAPDFVPELASGGEPEPTTVAEVSGELVMPAAAAVAGAAASLEPDIELAETPSAAPPPEEDRAGVGGAHRADGAPASAVTPSWSPPQRSRVQRAPAILFGLAGVLAIAATAAWLRGRGAERARPARAPASLGAPVPPTSPVPCPEPPTAPGCPPAAAPSGSGTSAPAPTAVRASDAPPASSGAGAPAASGQDAAPTPPPAVTPAAPGTPGAPATRQDPAKEAKALLLKARKAMGESNPTAALLYADEALALKKSARAHLARAAALQGLVRLDDALAAVDRAIAMSDDYADGWLARGQVLEALGRTGEAKAAYTRFLELAPNSSAAIDVRRRLGP